VDRSHAVAIVRNRIAYALATSSSDKKEIAVREVVSVRRKSKAKSRAYEKNLQTDICLVIAKNEATDPMETHCALSNSDGDGVRKEEIGTYLL
jgi:hypothetical protein